MLLLYPLFTLLALCLLYLSTVYSTCPLFTLFIHCLLYLLFVYYLYPLFTLLALCLLSLSTVYSTCPLFTLFIYCLLYFSFVYSLYPLFTRFIYCLFYSDFNSLLRFSIILRNLKTVWSNNSLRVPEKLVRGKGGFAIRYLYVKVIKSISASYSHIHFL